MCLVCSMAVHPDNNTIATGQVAGHEKQEGKVCNKKMLMMMMMMMMMTTTTQLLPFFVLYFTVVSGLTMAAEAGMTIMVSTEASSSWPIVQSP